MFKVTDLTCEMNVNPIGLDVPAPALSWQIESDKPFFQTAYRIKVELADKTVMWDSGRVESPCSTQVKYAGEQLQSRQKINWKVQVWNEAGKSNTSDTATWEMGLLELTDWQGYWIGAPNQVLNNWRVESKPAPYFRKSFIHGAGGEARVYICGLGYYELYINRKKVGDHVLDPVVTIYDKRVRYLTYDVTDMLKQGENELEVVLGNGWYNCQTEETWHFDKASWRDFPKLLLQLEVDGKVEVVSDTSWLVSEGPIRFDALRNGETYDARVGRTDALNAAICNEPGGTMQAQNMPPCKVNRTLPYIDSWDLPNGDVVFDIGQSMTGWIRVTVTGPAGSELVFKYAEKLTDEKELDQENIDRFIFAGDCQTDRYILNGEGQEVWEPRFTYHGFRYVQVGCLSEGVKIEALEGRFVCTTFTRIGVISSSSEVLNRLQRCTEWSYLGNFTGIPTDCPHREKNGWTGDAQLAAETGLFNSDAATAYRQWIDSIADAQRPSGQLPGIVPSSGWGYNWGSGPAWDSVFILIPWYIYVYTGDTSAIEKHYEGMRRYVDYCSRMATDNLVSFGLGDWCHWDRERIVPVEITSTGYYYIDTVILAKFAELTGRTDDCQKYTALAAEIKKSFNAKYYKGDGLYHEGGQTTLGCALYQGLVEDSEKAKVAQKLNDAVIDFDYKVDFGILGAKYVPRALADNGYVETAYKILTQPEYPGWAYWIKKGATTLWESWGGEGGSLNHIMFGDISAWMYQYLAGIVPNPDAPGFAELTIKPYFPADLDHFAAEYSAPRGLIKSSWLRTESGVLVKVTIPHNTRAQLVLPDKTEVLTPGNWSFKV